MERRNLCLCDRDGDNGLVESEFPFFLLFVSRIFFSSIERNHGGYLLTGVLLRQSFLRMVILTVTFLQNLPSSLPAKWAEISKNQLKFLTFQRQEQSWPFYGVKRHEKNTKYITVHTKLWWSYISCTLNHF